MSTFPYTLNMFFWYGYHHTPLDTLHSLFILKVLILTALETNLFF